MKFCFVSILVLSDAISEEDTDDPPHPDGNNQNREEFIGIEGYTADG